MAGLRTGAGRRGAQATERVPRDEAEGDAERVFCTPKRPFQPLTARFLREDDGPRYNLKV